MAFEADRHIPGGGLDLDVAVEDGTKFIDYCTTCEKVLYCATEDNVITRRVAQFVMEDHSSFFAEEHFVLIISKHNL